SKLEFRELALDRASTTAIPISNTGIIPAGGITTSNPTLGTTEDRHTMGITGIKCITVAKPRWAQSARIDKFVEVRIFDSTGNRRARDSVRRRAVRGMVNFDQEVG